METVRLCSLDSFSKRDCDLNSGLFYRSECWTSDRRWDCTCSFQSNVLQMGRGNSIWWGIDGSSVVFILIRYIFLEFLKPKFLNRFLWAQIFLYVDSWACALHWYGGVIIFERSFKLCVWFWRWGFQELLCKQLRLREGLSKKKIRELKNLRQRGNGRRQIQERERWLMWDFNFQVLNTSQKYFANEIELRPLNAQQQSIDLTVGELLEVKLCFRLKIFVKGEIFQYGIEWFWVEKKWLDSLNNLLIKIELVAFNWFYFWMSRCTKIHPYWKYSFQHGGRGHFCMEMGQESILLQEWWIGKMVCW